METNVTTITRKLNLLAKAERKLQRYIDALPGGRNDPWLRAWEPAYLPIRKPVVHAKRGVR